MKKLLNYTLLILALGLNFLFSAQITAFASETNTITSNTTITEDINITNNYTNYLVVDNSSTLEIKDCNITGDTETNNIFYVKSGSTLILNNVTITANSTYSIYNEGKVEIKNSSLNSIYNNSSENNSLILSNEVNINSITLNNGYTTILENTIINNEIDIIVNDESDSKLIVKGYGENVFANKLIDSFNLITKSSYFLDYIGDGCNVENADGYTLNQGDIVLTTYTLTTKESTLYSGNYCTGNRFLNSYAEEKQFPMYKCLSPAVILNNYTCNTSEYSYRKASNDYVIDLIVNRVYEDGNKIDSKEITYVSGSNRAIFVDIPEGYELVSTSISNDALSIEEYFSNNNYLRPIITYTLSSYKYIECSIDFVFSEKTPSIAELEIDKEDNVELEYADELLVGSTYTFSIKDSNEYRVTKVEFNEEEIELVDNSFSLTMLDTNLLKIYTIELPYEITVTPQEFSFIFGEDISLIQEVYIEETNEIVVVEFTRVDSGEVGSYLIIEGKCSNEDYLVNISDGEYYYHITKKQVNIDEIILRSVELIYSEELEITKEMFISYAPKYYSITMLFSSKDIKIGTQEVKFEIEVIDSNYHLDSSEQIISTTLIVNPKEINIDSYTLTNLESTYDGKHKTVDINNLDKELVLVEYKYYLEGTNVNEAINVGTYYIEAILSSNSLFYTVDTILTGYLVILPKEIDVIIVNTYEYNGEVPELETKVLGLVNEDEVEITLDTFNNTNAGTYTIDILGIDNPNYKLIKDYVELEILKAKVDMSNITYNDVTYTFDNLPHTPILTGVLPLGIEYTIEDSNCINVGEYKVKCSFLSTNPNYLSPEDMYAKVNITPKEIFVEYIPLTNAIADGSKKEIGINLIGLIPSDEVEYTITYSGDCILPGEYTCRVELEENSNYIISNTNAYTFLIYAGTTSYVSNNINLTLEGQFLPDSGISISDTTSNLMVVNAVADMKYEKYSSIEVTCEEIVEPITIKIQKISTIDTNRLSIYKLVDDKLERIKYTITNGLICFEITGTEMILFIEEKDMNNLLVFVITLLSTLLLGGVLVGIIYKRRKKIK